MKGSSALRLAVVVAAMAALFIILRMCGVDGSWFTEEHLRSFGVLAPLVFTVTFAVAVVLAVPGGPITVLAGSLFGVCQGTVVVSVGSTLGAAVAFLIARYAAREQVARWLSRNPRFVKLDKLIKARGFAVVAIVRLIPFFPFNLVNYGMGLTSVSFGYYVVMSWLCMLPGTVLYVAGGDVFNTALTGGCVPWRPICLCVVIVICLSAAYLVFRNSLDEGRDG